MKIRNKFLICNDEFQIFDILLCEIIISNYIKAASFVSFDSPLFTPQKNSDPGSMDKMYTRQGYLFLMEKSKFYCDEEMLLFSFLKCYKYSIIN